MGDLRGARVRTDVKFADATGITRMGQQRAVAKRTGVVEAVLSSTKTPPNRVTGLDLSALDIGGESHLALVKRMVFRGQAIIDEGGGVSDEWTYPVVTGKDFRALVEVNLDSNGPTAAMLAAYGNLAGLQVGLNLVLNGVNLSLPMIIGSTEHRMEPGQIQVWRFELRGNSPDSGDYPTSPLNGSLLAAAIQTPGTPLALIAASQAVNGIRYSGAFLPSAIRFDVREGEVVETQYRFISRGPVLAEVTV
ncbi:MAG: hypothetical protein R2688_06085 [Fimbriimonadaceae bacterium]